MWVYAGKRVHMDQLFGVGQAAGVQKRYCKCERCILVIYGC